MKKVKHAGIFIFFLAACVLMTLIIASTTGLSLLISGVIASLACTLVYLMLDTKPDHDPGEATIIRLTKGSWGREKDK